MKRPRKEKEWLDHIKSLFSTPRAPAGIGDDGAVLQKESWCLTTDALIEGVDFECGWAPPEAIGWKALAVNLSDLAAMGSKPSFFLLTLAIPANRGDAWIERLLAGIRSLAVKEKVSLRGGDLSGSPDKLVISITAAGIQHDKPLLRGKANPGDSIYVSSALGGAGEALSMFKSGKRLGKFPLAGKASPGDALLDRFFRPPSQSKLGLLLASEKIASSAIDISDGLLLDLSRLLEGSGNGAVLSEGSIPRAAGENGKPVTLQAAMASGEEQVLLFTVPRSRERLIDGLGTELFRIGFVTPKSGLWIQDGEKVSVLKDSGFDHFE